MFLLLDILEHVIGGHMMTRLKKGAIFGVELLVVIAILAVLVGCVAVNYYRGDWGRTTIAEEQARQIDKKLFEYTRAHTSIQAKNILGGTTNDTLKLKPTPDYPLAINSSGAIIERNTEMTGGHSVANSDKPTASGYFDTTVQFIDRSANGDEAQNLYKFKYIPLDKDGNEIAANGRNSNIPPAVYYRLEYYTKNFFGKVVRNESPRSYSNIKK